jgi:tRNA-specific 2-thiouridylase
VIVGMSGGVDSSVAALLLKRQGFDVGGVFMKNWEDFGPEGPCPAERDARDALAACDRIGIELDAVNFADRYRERVFAHFLAEIRAGRTPNPDVLCNSEIKFRAFLDHALGTGAGWIATGHYAGVVERDGRFHLLRGRDPEKDQSYFLHGLSQEQLSRAVFPLHGLLKREVRGIAREAGLANHAKKDSTGICFIGERRFRAFLSRYVPERPGEIRGVDGRLLGAHAGVEFYTLGQRQGLGVGGRAGGNGRPWYVVAKDLPSNTLVVAQGHDHSLLYSRQLVTGPIHWIQADPTEGGAVRCTARVRYRQADQACIVGRIASDRYRVTFDVAQWAITAGQSAVFYQGDECLGGGVIEEVGIERTGIQSAIRQRASAGGVG